MKLHLPVHSGSIGHIDKYGYGGKASTWDYPSLGLERMVFKSTTGGIVYPELFGVKPTFKDKPYWAPFQEWGKWEPTYKLPDGRVLVAVSYDGQYAFQEKEIDDDES